MSIKTNRTWLKYMSLLAIGSLFALSTTRSLAESCPANPAAGFLGGECPTSSTTAVDPTAISAINAQIADKQKQIDDLKQQEAQYQAQIDQTQTVIQSQQAEVSAINNQIALADLDIRQKQAQLDSLELEIRSLQLTIDQKNADIENRKTVLADTIRQLDSSTRVTPLALVMQYNNFNEFYSQAQAQAQMSTGLESSIGDIKKSKNEIQAKQDELQNVNDDTKQAKSQLEVQRSSIQQQRDFQIQLLGQSKSSQNQYKELINQKYDEEASVNGSIDQLRGKLQAVLSGTAINQADQPSPQGYIWPVSSAAANGRVVTCTFHCVGYPWGIHYGLDIGVFPWTAIYAIADGTLMMCGQGSGNYFPEDGICAQPSNTQLSVLGVQHGGHIASEYFHLIQFAPNLKIGQAIFRGELIGYSGGAVGAIGSGTQTRGGGHLHLQIGRDANLAIHDTGTPVDPMNYLPGE